MSGYCFPPLMDSWSVFTSLPNISHQICLVFACVNEAQRWSSNQAFMLHKIKKNKFCQAVEWSRQQRLTQIKANSQKKGKKKIKFSQKVSSAKVGRLQRTAGHCRAVVYLCPLHSVRCWGSSLEQWWGHTFYDGSTAKTWCGVSFLSVVCCQNFLNTVIMLVSHLAPGMKKPERNPILWLLRKLIYTDPCKNTRKLFKE